MTAKRASYKKGERPTIRTQVIIIAIIAAAIIVAVFLSNQAYSDTKKRATDQFNQQQLALARSAATGIENFIINLEDNLLGLSELPGVQRMELGIQAELKAMCLSFPSETSLRRLDKNGTLRFIYPYESWRMELVGRNYSGEAYFQKAKDTGDVVVSGLMLNEKGEMRIRIVKPVYIEDEKGSEGFNGLIIASIDPEVLSEMYISPAVSGETGYAWLLNEESVFLAHHEEDFVGHDAFKVREEKNPELSYEVINNIQRQMIAGEEGIDRYVSGWHRGRVERIDKYIAYVPVPVGDHIWSVAVCAPIEEVERIIAAAHPRELLILGYIILVLIAGGSIFVIFERRKKSILEHEVKSRTKELRESEEEYRSLVKSTEDSVYLVDRNCKYLFMNEKHLSRLGLPADEIISRAYGELHSEEETKELAEVVNQVFETGKSIQHEHRSRRDNRYFLRTLSPVKEPDGSVASITVVSKEISALKRTETELIETKDYLDDIIMSSADTITVVDMNGIVRDWNKGAEGIMGYRAAEVIGTPNSKFFADPADANRIMNRVQKDGELKNYRTIALRKDGKPVHISMSAALLKDKDGVPTGTVRVSRDITTVVELEERIKEERDNLNLIFESMVDGVYIVSKDYEIEFMNKVLIDVVGDQTGDICYKAFHEREEPCPQCKSPEVVNGKSVRWEWYSRRMNMTYDLVETPLTNIDGTISKLTIFRDVSERKRLEEARARAEERQLQLLDELEKANTELKDFAYIVSHDLKAPLRAITSLAEWLSADYSDKLDEAGKEQLALLLSRVKRMHNLIESILEYSRIGRMKENKQEIDLNTLVSDVITMINPPEDVEITVEDKLPTILCDRTKVEQVFQNLLSNAVRYMDKPKGQITIGCSEESGYWKFYVADNGSGIEERYYEKIFQIFQTLKPRDEVESTGVGLSIVKKIVELQGGEIWVDSKVGDGTTFFFRLPKESKGGAVT